MQAQSELEGRAWLARIRHAATGAIHGAGFAIDGSHVITAAHVAREAGATGPGDRVRVDFPLLPGLGCEADVLEDGWSSEGDQALLRLAAPPAGVVPPPFQAIPSLDGHTFTAYGFPAGYADSVAVTGRAGKAASLKWVTLTVDHGLPIAPGFSGAAVWSDHCDAVVAMIVTRDRASAGRVAFAVPMGHLADRSELVAKVMDGETRAGPSRAPHARTGLAPSGTAVAGGDAPAVATAGPGRAGDRRLDRIRLAYDRLEALTDRELSPRRRIAAAALRGRLDEAAVDLLRGDGDAAAQAVESALMEIADMHRSARPLSDGAPLRGSATYTSGAAVMFRFTDPHSTVARSPETITNDCIRIAEELREATGRRVTTDCTGTTMLIVLEDERPDRGFSTRALFAAAMALHRLAIGQGRLIASILTHGDDLVRLGSTKLGSDSVTGSTVTEAALLLESCSEPVFLIAADAFPLLRGSSALRLGRGHRCSVIAQICEPYFPIDDLFEPSAAQYDCAMTRPRVDLPHLTAYTLTVSRGEDSEPVIGTPARTGFPTAYEHLAAPEGPLSDCDLLSALATADRIELVGTTNYRLADLLDRAWAIRTARGLGPWLELTVYYAVESLLPVIDPASTHVTERSQRRSASTKTVRMLLNSRESMAVQRRLAEFSFAIPFTGAKLGEGGETRYSLALNFPGQQGEDRAYFQVSAHSEFGHQAAKVFGLLREHSRELFEREVWLAKGDPSTSATLGGLYGHHPTDLTLRMATALVVLHAETAGRQGLLIQKRTVFNARDEAGRYSNVSGRLLESDLCGLDTRGELTVARREDSDEVVTTRIFRQLGLHTSTPLPRRAYLLALVRECLSGLGLTVDEDRFVWHTECELTVGTKRLAFQIFSLELTRGPVDEVTLIQEQRPYANIRFMSRSEIENMAQHSPDRLNTLLARNMYETFIPIFDTLDIA
ncbi:serine protease [Streptomyces mirabilis]|uniref:S1 family peptidase n=1 Tax=Streptomyces mirabilis TaxID=68239 RepID=UPI0036827D32